MFRHWVLVCCRRICSHHLLLGSCVRAFAAGAQILLLVRDDRVRAFPKSYYESVANILTERFGGGTASTRTPAEGRWKKKVSEDDIVVFEVMVDTVAGLPRI